MVLDLRDICKSYMQGKEPVPVLHHIQLQVEEGEYLAIMGPSGSGKSTLMNIIGLLDKQTSGDYFFDGQDMAQCSDNQLSTIRNQKIGFVFQNFNLLPRQSVLENVALPLLYAGVRKKERLERAKEMLARVGLEERIQFKPTQLSGGQKQRVAIARAMVSQPRLLLADEPTGAVDSKTSDMIQDLFRKLNEEMGITVIIVTHDISLANKVGRVVMIADGKISTEKIMKEDYRKRINDMESESFNGTDSHEEYSIMDKAHRVQISDDILEAAGIDTNKVKIQVVDGKVVISKE